MIVMKFGGTSLGSRERLERMAQIVANEGRSRAVVVSAMGCMTDRLLEAGREAERGDTAAVEQLLAELRETVEAALPAGAAVEAHGALFRELEALLRGVTALREQTSRSRALLASFGERLTVGIARLHLERAGVDAVAVDARELICTDDRHEEARVDRAVTNDRIRVRLGPLLEEGTVPVVTGFLGSTPEGVTTVLGRSGSDYTAALLGAALGAEEVEIWTDVDGILTADPRKVGEARSLAEVSYREAAEMSYFGAQVVHPKTMVPLAPLGIPIRVRSTFQPERPGTRIGPHSQPEPHGVKTVTSVDGLAMLTVEGRGLSGKIGVAKRLFAIAEQAGVNVVMISQASSEQSISVVVRAEDADRLQPLLGAAFELEIEAGMVAPIRRDAGVSVLSIVGEGMAGRPGVSARLFDALGQLQVSVRAIAQGASELSISVALDAASIDRAVRAVHARFGLTRVVHVALLGVGTVGRAFLEMLHTVDLGGLKLQLLAVASSRRWCLDPNGIEPAEAIRRLERPRPDDAGLIEALRAHKFAEVVLVDLTASPTAALHRMALEAGFHVVTANKVPLAGSMASYRELVRARDRAGVRYGYETTFGAGLPVLHTLKELLTTGDRVEIVEGCLSGTLGFLCTALDDGLGLAEAVEQAKTLGYTEPDPRDDLAGTDVARKALIIARAMGRALELEDVELQPFVPGLEAGLEVALAAHGDDLARRVAAARAEDRVLRYVVRIAERVTVGLREVPRSSPIGSLRGPDNLLLFRTGRYAEHPLVVRGPGAGAAVTAAGVLGDVLKIARR